MDTKLSKNIQSYIELVYSEKSELSTMIGLEDRKRAACKKLKMDMASEEVKKIINLEDDKVRDHVFDHLCRNESSEFMNLMTDQHLLLQIQEIKMTPLTISDDEEKMLKAMNLKTTMSTKGEELLARINAAYIKIFKGNAEIKSAKKKVNWLTLEQRIKHRDEQRLKQQTQPESVPSE